METTIYTFKGKRGITDLRSEYAFVGNSQGDESRSNSIEDYIAAKGWMSYVFSCSLNQDAIDKEAKRRKQRNSDYIKQLKEEGRFEEEYEIKLELVNNPTFDSNNVIIANNSNPLESFKLIFLD